MDEETQAIVEPAADVSVDTTVDATVDTSSTPEFALPDEYKDKPWASKITSNEDLYKQVDNLTGLVGKKTIQPLDYEAASEEEIAAHHASTAPENGAEGYVWDEGSMPEFTGPMGNALAKAGINAHQQAILSEEFQSIASELSANHLEANTSSEDYLSIAKESFGDGFEETLGNVENSIKENSNDTDKGLFDALDNNTRSAVDRLVNSINTKAEERVAAILKEHGVAETGAQINGANGSPNTASAFEQRAAIRKEMNEIDGSMGAGPRLAELQSQLDKLLQNV